ncbi:hypothetical protein Tb10.70.2880 [Trypanosoma brucei brucei TREU927]|uniref:Uncharacterized protein n=1 Tax=Trypanosoma brucei brucei (strain 927/4 GUTat10.1) TaxID=185431 RepID=Q38BG5_TRYB2|nr:hypothetical protein Tb10.70.2880 [Trypanosoma brucei brucei TREU927]EAN77855.1 hypothetical protein Tb10.70.2880 [Trypanosoma brucei brucei TREU927]
MVDKAKTREQHPLVVFFRYGRAGWQRKRTQSTKESNPSWWATLLRFRRTQTNKTCSKKHD